MKVKKKKKKIDSSGLSWRHNFESTVILYKKKKKKSSLYCLSRLSIFDEIFNVFDLIKMSMLERSQEKKRKKERFSK